MNLERLKDELSKIGTIANIKEGYVFTLLMFSENKNIAKNTLRIMELVCEYTHDKYPIIEVIRNEDDYYLTVLKPKDIK